MHRFSALLAAVILPMVLAASAMAAPVTDRASEPQPQAAPLSGEALTATIAAGSGTDAVLDVTGYYLPDGSGATYV
ncbi:MAG: hypothetical protein WEG56_00680, partial [Chloroflexota bacterium]